MKIFPTRAQKDKMFFYKSIYDKDLLHKKNNKMKKKKTI